MMNIIEKLKNAPRGTKLYSPICGEVILDNIIKDDYISVGDTDCYLSWNFNLYGQYITDEGTVTKECLLFPSKEVREWDNFSIKKEV